MNRALICLPLLAALYGCNTQPPIDARQELWTPKQIQIADEDLRLQTRFETPRVTYDQSGLMYITVPLRATINETLHVQYRATFLDANGQPLPGSPTTWFDKTLNPRVFDSVTVNSTSPKAESFTLDFRYAR
jgi:hypothetical protein